jgi:hypothetical protein
MMLGGRSAAKLRVGGLGFGKLSAGTLLAYSMSLRNRLYIPTIKELRIFSLREGEEIIILTNNHQKSISISNSLPELHLIQFKLLPWAFPNLSSHDC